MNVGHHSAAELTSLFRTQRDEVLLSARSGQATLAVSTLTELGRTLSAEASRDASAAGALDSQLDALHDATSPFAQSVWQRFSAADVDFRANTDLAKAFSQLKTQVELVLAGPGDSPAQAALHRLASDANVVGLHLQAGTLTAAVKSMDEAGGLRTWFDANAAALASSDRQVKQFQLELAR